MPTTPAYIEETTLEKVSWPANCEMQRITKARSAKKVTSAPVTTSASWTSVRPRRAAVRSNIIFLK